MLKKISFVIAAAVLGLGSWNASAQPESNLNFGQLVLGGSIGALVGGVGTAFGIYSICIMTTPAGPWTDLACLANAIVFGYLPGVPIGATVGVSFTGRFQRVTGNVWVALVGASLGGAVAFFASDWALRALGETSQAQAIRDTLIPTVFLGIIPIAAGTGAAWGYSVTAQPHTR